ncbi:divalent-cation tolerance protein CutA [Pontixanthobacter aquaemixtae]|uniref:Divalent cation tolerance protein CutA n=1 Tax=Pontixanthobacter aquaemixtae TaxID=1958940 RepID=A0A845A1C4_9SPHN|nr:divalent-cation tolerance protein CutA [Pontixanthobacter aquaemixtae]MXO91449.1 divalent cation tolerance protein CutA [Pontixanthobacter aquaemixtae]
MSALIWTVFADKQQAAEISGKLVEEKLVACANMMDGVTSLFLWQGTVDTANEVGVLFKTDGTLLNKAVARLEALHPYNTPAILGWKCDASAGATAAWLKDLTG